MRPTLLSIFLLFGSAIPASAQQLKEITNSIGMKLVLIHAGSFAMGSSSNESGRKDRELLHEVTLTKSFYLGVHEVTQRQYAEIMGAKPDRPKANSFPMQNVSWEEAVAFCEKLSEHPAEKAMGRVYRLPTEAEWEYSCRATSGAAFCFGDSVELLGDFAWYKDEVDFFAFGYPVGLKKANRWGLHDMHGNVHEWCQDWYAEYSPNAVTDPSGPSRGHERVFRGGSWSDIAEKCRSSYRFSIVPTFSSSEIGFRVAMNWSAKESVPVPTK